jgi:hypothetical protein
MDSNSLSETRASVYVAPMNDEWRLRVEAAGAGGEMVERLAWRDPFAIFGGLGG